MLLRLLLAIRPELIFSYLLRPGMGSHLETSAEGAAHRSAGPSALQFIGMRTTPSRAWLFTAGPSALSNSVTDLNVLFRSD